VLDLSEIIDLNDENKLVQHKIEEKMEFLMILMEKSFQNIKNSITDWKEIWVKKDIKTIFDDINCIVCKRKNIKGKIYVSYDSVLCECCQEK